MTDRNNNNSGSSLFVLPDDVWCYTFGYLHSHDLAAWDVTCREASRLVRKLPDKRGGEIHLWHCGHGRKYQSVFLRPWWTTQRRARLQRYAEACTNSCIHIQYNCRGYAIDVRYTITAAHTVLRPSLWPYLSLELRLVSRPWSEMRVSHSSMDRSLKTIWGDVRWGFSAERPHVLPTDYESSSILLRNGAEYEDTHMIDVLPFRLVHGLVYVHLHHPVIIP